jgi:tubulin beta
MGAKFWETISDEHGIGPTGHFYGDSDLQLDRIDVYYHEGQGGRYVPRAVLADLEPATLDSLRGGLYGQLFRPSNVLASHASGGNNFAIGYYGAGQEFVEPVLDAIRQEAERCDCLQGFQLTHSLSGGTGSGFGTLLLNKLREEYPDRILSTYSIFPSVDSDVVTAPYNAVLSVHQLIESADAVFCMDNESLYSLCMRKLHLAQPTYEDINSVVSLIMSGTTCSLRFPGQLNADLRKLLVNLVPWPRLHFFLCGFGPLLPRTGPSHPPTTVRELLEELPISFHRQNRTVACEPKRGVWLAGSVQFRGLVSPYEVDDQILYMQARHTSYFVEWIPFNLRSSICNIPPRGLRTAATFVGNSTATRELFTPLDCKFCRMYARRAFVMSYVNEGMETVEFGEARSDMTELFQEYETCDTEGVEELDYDDDDL